MVINEKSGHVGTLVQSMKGVIFDIDGTIADSMSFWKKLDYRFMQHLGRDVVISDDFHEKCCGMSLPQSVSCLIEDFDLGISVDAGMDIITEMATDFYRNQIELKEGVLDFMHHLKTRSIPFGFSTATSPAFVRALMSRFPAIGLMVGDTFTTTCMVNAGKPAPDVFLRTAELMAVAPSDIVVFEDALHGVQGALNAGMSVVGIKDGDNLGRRPEIEAVAHGFIESWGELMEMLEGTG